MNLKKTKGFTLLEIMIVVAMIGFLATMAMPAHVRARVTSREAVCLNNLRILLTAKMQHAVDAQKQNGDVLVPEDLDPYLKAPFATLAEPAGTSDEVRPVGEGPICVYGGSHSL